jgi:hypothetical protein
MNPVIEALSLLTPFDIDIPKRRIGPHGDGGYIFADKISPSQAVLSYGVGMEYRFDREMAEAGHKVFMFDHTIDGIDRAHANMMWHREGVAGKSDPGNSLYSITDHLQRHDITGNALILKIDVEGEEYNAIGSTPEHVLCRFEQIVLEVHELERLAGDETFRANFVTMLRNINKHFTLFHVHANNCDGGNALFIISGVPVSSLLELSYIRTASVRRSPSRTLYPTALDYPNTRHKDKLLWFFPFLPTHLSSADFIRCESRIQIMHQARQANTPV